MLCPYCEHEAPTIVKNKIGSGTIMCGFFYAIIGCCIFAFIPFCFKCYKVNIYFLFI